MDKALAAVAFAAVAAATVTLGRFRRQRTRYAQGLGLLFKRLGLMYTEEGNRYGREFQARPTDVFVTSYPKSGTTLLQQLVQQLRSGGRMDFDDIGMIMPWTLFALDVGIDIDADQPYSPRAFKSHDTWEKIAKGGKYLYIVRDPVDVLLSCYYFVVDWVDVPFSAVSLDEFNTYLFCRGGTKSGNYFDHISSWWPRRDDTNVLFLCYEDIQEDKAACVRIIADFMGVECTPELLQATLDHSTKAFMAEHQLKFYEVAMAAKCRTRMGITSMKGSVGKIRTSGSTREAVTPAMKALVKKRWDETVLPATGLASYEELRGAVSVLRAKD
mmetsp:Transcript_11964/g.40459  ORF Transcript_11964/g.40459 Transcript_11964/m.40459 type:complete len:328 (+) Transcript_11964:46-1029(+)